MKTKILSVLITLLCACSAVGDHSFLSQVTGYYKGQRITERAGEHSNFDTRDDQDFDYVTLRVEKDSRQGIRLFLNAEEIIITDIEFSPEGVTFNIPCQNLAPPQDKVILLKGNSEYTMGKDRCDGYIERERLKLVFSYALIRNENGHEVTHYVHYRLSKE